MNTDISTNFILFGDSLIATILLLDLLHSPYPIDYKGQPNHYKCTHISYLRSIWKFLVISLFLFVFIGINYITDFLLLTIFLPFVLLECIIIFHAIRILTTSITLLIFGVLINGFRKGRIWIKKRCYHTLYQIFLLMDESIAWSFFTYWCQHRL